MHTRRIELRVETKISSINIDINANAVNQRISYDCCLCAIGNWIADNPIICTTSVRNHHHSRWMPFCQCCCCFMFLYAQIKDDRMIFFVCYFSAISKCLIWSPQFDWTHDNKALMIDCFAVIFLYFKFQRLFSILGILPTLVLQIREKTWFFESFLMWLTPYLRAPFAVRTFNRNHFFFILSVALWFSYQHSSGAFHMPEQSWLTSLQFSCLKHFTNFR